jgi:hypothetical protein
VAACNDRFDTDRAPRRVILNKPSASSDIISWLSPWDYPSIACSMRTPTMPFTVRLDGKTVATFDTEEAAVARARAILRDDADKQPEVIDAETGQPVAPGANQGSRDDLARKVGF